MKLGAYGLTTKLEKRSRRRRGCDRRILAAQVGPRSYRISNDDCFTICQRSQFCKMQSVLALPALIENNLMQSLRRILLVEDDPELSAEIADFLATEGYQIDQALTGDEGLRLGRTNSYAVMLIDRMLPGLDGLSVIQQLRNEGNDAPALIISALGEVYERVRALRAGGDDYLAKPFALAELLARVEALAPRSATIVKETILRAGDLELDLVSRAATRAGKAIKLLPREFKLLEYLVRNQGKVVPRSMLLQNVWDLHFDPTTNIIDVYVGRLRRKVDGEDAYPLIHTVRGIGFCLRAPG